MIGIILAMAIGASACSTGGGFKGIRMGLIFKSMTQTIRRLLSPESAYVVRKWHHITTRILDEPAVHSAMLIVIFYILTYAIGAIVGVFYGYEPVQALFDSVSAGSNTGLSCGVTSPAMPVLMKIVYIIEMWAGRLEFMSLFALGGYIMALFRGR
jgi:trk system potassium uptake protein TrkH